MVIGGKEAITGNWYIIHSDTLYTDVAWMMWHTVPTVRGGLGLNKIVYLFMRVTLAVNLVQMWICFSVLRLEIEI